MSNYQQNPQDMYHDYPTSRSPGSQRHQPQQPQQQLHRQTSRQFDAYGSMPSSAVYDDFAARYDSRAERLNPGLPVNAYGYDSQTWNSSNGLGAGVHPFGSVGAVGGSASNRMKPNVRNNRTGLPPTWLDQQPAMPNSFQVPPGQMQPTPMRPDNMSQEGEDELIPTAIVIKNIPFAVKKEQLIQLMTELSLPLPYAFNYHFDNGVFRGLAFANFTSAEETAVVIEALNHFDLQGRKLRVEYKKMLPLQERERIEREKRERRGQLEEQHRPMAPSQLQSQASMSSLTSHLPTTSPSPVSQQNTQKLEVDMNDAQTLTFYSELLIFKRDPSREVFIFPSTLTPVQRRIVHTLSHNMGLFHVSHGSGEQRQVHVFRSQPGANGSPLESAPTSIPMSDSARRGLNRAATIDFSEARAEAPTPFSSGRSNTNNNNNNNNNTTNSAFLNVMDSSGGMGNPQNLRAAKSIADLRSFTPSPVPSSASFPAALQANGGRFAAYDNSTSGASNTPTLTPTPGSSLNMQRPEDNLLVSSLGGLSLGTSVGGGTSGSPHRLRGMFSWEGQPQGQQGQQQQSQDAQSPANAPIGSNRSIGFEQSQERVPVRQPRGPAPERGSGFRRQNGHQTRSSDEIRSSSGVEIIVE